MNLLLDTHAAFWSIVDERQLSSNARTAIEAPGNEVHVSIVSAWEMAIKVGIGKWDDARALVEDFEAELSRANVHLLPISVSHVRAAGLMRSAHRDPFDRLLAAQATVEGLTLVTADGRLQSLGPPWLW